MKSLILVFAMAFLKNRVGYADCVQLLNVEIEGKKTAIYVIKSKNLERDKVLLYRLLNFDKEVWELQLKIEHRILKQDPTRKFPGYGIDLFVTRIDLLADDTVKVTFKYDKYADNGPITGSKNFGAARTWNSYFPEESEYSIEIE